MVCFIHRPEYYKVTEDTQGNSLIGLAEIIIAKHRNGATGDIMLRFKGQFAKFMNKDDEDETSYQGYISKINENNSFMPENTISTNFDSYPPPPVMPNEQDVPF
jgi:replicative DNA helicase